MGMRHKLPKNLYYDGAIVAENERRDSWLDWFKKRMAIAEKEHAGGHT